MATVTIPTDDPRAAQAPVSGLQPYLITVDVYERMVNAGIFGPKDRLILWNGRLVRKMTKNPPHVFAHNQLARRIQAVVPAGWFAEQDQPMTLGDYGCPEPDVKVVRGSPDAFRSRTPTAGDVCLIAEVADSSLPFDVGEILENYARGGVLVYWVVNLPDRRVEVYSDPTGPAEQPTYQSRQDYGPDDEVPVVLDGREVGRVLVRDILP